MDEEQQVITVWAEDKPGVLMLVATILTAKGVNVEQLTAAPEPASAWHVKDRDYCQS